uniref:tyrosine-type recombinase/integrase n=1 Tax=Acetatifactor sp. TaxID=1872090 RepID=UPI0040566B2E
MSTTQPIRDLQKLKAFEEYYRYVKPNRRNYLLIVFGLNSTLRISDILQLTYGDIYDYERREWKTHLVVIEQKTGKTNRIYMNREIKECLESYSDYLLHCASDWLFKGQISTEQPLSRYQAFRIIKKAASHVGLDTSVSCHSLRKTFGYHAWKQGIPPALLMDIYNHSSYQITKRYLGIEQDDKDKVFENICL